MPCLAFLFPPNNIVRSKSIFHEFHKGLAVIAPNEGGPATVIADGETGRLFRSRDLDSLSAAMHALREDPRERERLGAAAQSAVADYHPDAVAQQLERVYECVLREAGHGDDRDVAKASRV